MNEVSWLIYFSNISPNIGGLLIFIGILILLIAGAYLLWSCIVTDDLTKWHAESGQKNLDVIEKVFKTRKPLPVLVSMSVAFWIIAAFCPSQETVLAIAASEFGEQMLHSKTANLAEQALDSWLQRQIHPAPAPEAK